MNDDTKEEAKVVLYISQQKGLNCRTTNSDIVGDEKLLKEYIKEEAIKLLQNL